MRIREIRAEGFGSLRDKLLTLEGPLTVIYGPNEAGKSTLLHLIRAVLFGFPQRGNTAERFEPAGGGMGPHGGGLTLETPEGQQIKVVRRSTDPAGRRRAPSEGVMTVRLPDGSSGGEELLARMLGGMPVEQFRNLFAFSLTELQELRTLTAGELGGFLYSAGLGVRASVIVEAEKRLASELDARFKPRGKNQELNRQLVAIGELEAELRRSEAVAGRYNGIAEERERLIAEIRIGEAQLIEARDRWGSLKGASQCQDRWLRREAARRELAELKQRGTPFPEEGLQRQKELLLEGERLLSRMDELRVRLEQLNRSASERPAGDAKLLSARSKLEELLERLGAYRAALQQESELKAEYIHIQERLDKQRGSLGSFWSEERLLSQLPTFAQQEEVKEWVERCSGLARKREALEADAGAMRRRLEEAQRVQQEREAELLMFRKELEERFPLGVRELAVLLPEELRELRRELAEGERIKREWEFTEQREWELLAARYAVEAQSGETDPAAGLTGIGAAAVIAGIGLAVWFGVRGEPGLAAGSFLLLAGLGAAVLYLGRARRIGGNSSSPRHMGKDKLVVAAGSGETSGMRETRSDSGVMSRAARSGRAAAAASTTATASAAATALVQASAVKDDPLALKKQRIAEERDAWTGRLQLRLEALAAFPEAAAASTALVGGDGPGVVDLGLADRIEQWSLKLQDVLSEERRLEERCRMETHGTEVLLEQLGVAESAIVSLEAEQAAFHRAWEEWSSPWTRGMRLPPDRMTEWFRLLEQGRELALRKQKLAAQLRVLEEEACRFEAEAGALLAGQELRQTGLGTPSAGDEQSAMQVSGLTAAAVGWRSSADLPAALRQEKLETDLAMRRESSFRMEEEERKNLRAEFGILEQALQRNREKLEQLWRQGGAADEEAFRRHASEEERRKLLAAEIRAADELLAASVGTDRLGELETLLQRYSAAELADELARMEQECADTERRLIDQRDAKARLSAELEKLEQDAGQGEKRQRLEEAYSRFRDDAGQWAVMAMCAGLFRKARETYERERQPGVLKEASSHFARMTEGRYKRVMVPFGEKRILAERADGETMESSMLSRGTAEQLYLAIRFALADAFARQTPLPLIMDDIFVNFDRGRLDASAAELGILSERHQVILFTCHPHVVEAVERRTSNHQIIRL